MLSGTSLISNFQGIKSKRFALGDEPNIIKNLDIMQGITSPLNSHVAMSSSRMSCFSPSGNITSIKLVKDASATLSKNYIVAKAGSVVWMASVSGALTTGSALSWAPLIGTVIQTVSGRVSYPITERISSSPEGVVQYGAEQYDGATYSNVYIACNEPGDNDKGYRWSGFTYSTGTAYATGSTVTGSGANFFDAGVWPGDIIYFYDNPQSKWRCTSGYPGYVISAVTSGTLTVYGTTISTSGIGIGGSNYTEYVIHRLQPMGINMPGASGQVVSMTDTMYKGVSVSGVAGDVPYHEVTCSYVYRYGDYRTGIYTDYSNSASNAVSAQTNTVSGWITEPDDPRLNTLEIYRAPYDVSTSTAGAYSLVATRYRVAIDSSSRTMGAFPSGYVDTIPKITVTADNTLTGYDLAHGKPYYDELRGLYMHGGRLYSTYMAYGDFNKKQLVMSHLVQISRNYSQTKGLEYWNWRTDSAETGNILDNGGGWVGVGNGAEYITSLRSEGCSFNQTGISDAALLVFTNQHVYRWQGSTWSTFRLNTVSRIDGPQSFNHTCSVDGVTYWISNSGIWTLETGGSTPTLISGKVFPTGLHNQNLTDWELTPLGSSLLLTGVLTGADGDALGISGAFSMIIHDGKFSQVSQAVRTADYVNLPGYSVRALAASGNTVYAFLSGDEAVDCVFRTLPLVLSDAPSLLCKGKKFGEVTVYMHPDSVDRTLTLNVYDHDSSAVIASVSGTVESSTNSGIHRIIKFFPEQTYVRPSLELTWTGTNRMALSYITAFWSVQGDSSLLDSPTYDSGAE